MGKHYYTHFFPICQGKFGQHRTIWQEHSAKDFASYESYKRAGILYVFPPFITARMGQKIGRRPQTQLCGDAFDYFPPRRGILPPVMPCFSPNSSSFAWAAGAMCCWSFSGGGLATPACSSSAGCASAFWGFSAAPAAAAGALRGRRGHHGAGARRRPAAKSPPGAPGLGLRRPARKPPGADLPGV